MRRPEEQLQRALVAHLRARLPKPWLVWATPNGGGRSKAEAGILKAMGTLAGMPDLFVLGPRWGPGQYVPTGGLRPDRIPPVLLEDLPRLIAIELKAPPKPTKSGRPSTAKPRVSDVQREVIEQLGQCGVPTLVVDNLDEALRALAALGVPLKGRTP